MSETAETTETALAVRRPRDIATAIPAKLQYAKALAESGLLPAQFRRQPGNILFAVEYGEMLGLAPMAAITGIHVIEGKPTASAGLISALVRRAGHRLRVKGDAKSATCQIIRCDDPDYTFEVTWTLKRNGDDNPSAEEAGLLGKQVWKNYPASMLKSRAITQCARDACEEALFGLHYTPEELGAEVDEEGNILTAVIVDEGQVTDLEWLDRSMARIPKMDSLGELRGLWSESVAMVGDGKCTQADAAALQSVIRKRMDQVREAEAKAPEIDPDDEWVIRIRDIATPEEAAEVQAELLAEFGEHAVGDARVSMLQAALALRTAELGGTRQDGPRCPEGRIIDGEPFQCIKPGGHPRSGADEDLLHEDENGERWAAPGDAPEAEEAEFVHSFMARLADADENGVRSLRIALGKAVSAGTIGHEIANELGANVRIRAESLRSAA